MRSEFRGLYEQGVGSWGYAQGIESQLFKSRKTHTMQDLKSIQAPGASMKKLVDIYLFRNSTFCAKSWYYNLYSNQTINNK